MKVIQVTVIIGRLFLIAVPHNTIVLSTRMDDQLIIQEILNEQEAVYAQLVKKYTDSVFRIAMGFVHQQQDAEDITQEVFIRAFQSLQQFKMEASFSTWLMRIAINHSQNFLKKRKRRSVWDKAASFFGAGATVADSAALLDEKDEYRIVRAALDQLPERQQQAFILSKYQDLSQKEIAAVMQLTEGAVEQLLVRARTRLRNYFEKKS